jgi:hypothetical protein
MDKERRWGIVKKEREKGMREGRKRDEEGREKEREKRGRLLTEDRRRRRLRGPKAENELGESGKTKCAEMNLD